MPHLNTKLEQTALALYQLRREIGTKEGEAEERRSYILDQRGPETPKNYEGVLADITFSPVHDDRARNVKLLFKHDVNYWYKKGLLKWNIPAIKEHFGKGADEYLIEGIKTYNVYPHLHVPEALLADPAKLKKTFKLLEDLRKVQPDSRTFLRELLLGLSP